jgi:hypothetical protein
VVVVVLVVVLVVVVVAVVVAIVPTMIMSSTLWRLRQASVPLLPPLR